MNYMLRVNTLYPTLSKSEKKIADYIKKIDNEIIYKTMQEVSKEVDVGEATIMRFCRKIGFDGFQDLKLEIAKQNTFSKEQEYEDFTVHIANNMCNTINETKLAINQELINQAIEMILSAKNLYLFGSGASGTVALELQQKFIRYGKLCHFTTDSHFQLMHAALATSKDVVIAFTLSGGTVDVFEAVSLAKKNNAQVIVVTNYMLSPVASLADCLLLTCGKESPLDGGSFAAKLSQLYISDVLVTGYALKYKDSKKMKQKCAEAVITKSI
ncbi:MAG: MurR/RpiR family transcriptional regulator [Coprobacillus sp.]